MAHEFTIIPVMYRDASNYKAHAELIATGTITAAQTDALRAALDQGEYFVPTQVGLDHLGPELPGFPQEDDHVWHELDIEDISTSDTAADGIEVGAIDEFVAVMTQAAADGWDDTQAL